MRRVTGRRAAAHAGTAALLGVLLAATPGVLAGAGPAGVPTRPAAPAADAPSGQAWGSLNREPSSTLGTSPPPARTDVWVPGASTVEAAWEDAPGDRGTRALRLVLRSEDAGAELLIVPPAGEELTERRYDDVRSLETPRTDKARLDLDVTQGTDGCAREAWGAVDVVELADDLSRVRVRFERQCEGAAGRTFGEVVLGAPAPGGPSAAASAVGWPAEHVGVAGLVVPVVVTGRTAGSGPVAARLDDDRHFRVVGSTCASGAGSPTCRVLVGFEPREPGAHGTTLRLEDATGVTAVPLTGTGRPGRTRWQVATPRSTSTQLPTSTDIVAQGDRSELRVRVDDGTAGGDATVHVTAPGGGLVAGRTYRGVGSFPSLRPDAAPGLSVAGTAGSDADAGEDGTFTVHEAAYGPDGGMRRIVLTYRVGEGAARTSGSIAWQAQDPVAPTAPPPPGPDMGPELFQMAAEPRVAGLDVTWSLTGRAQFETQTATVRVRPVAGGATRTVYRGTERRASVRGLLPGEDVELLVQVVDEWGNPSRTLRDVIRGSRLVLTSSGGRVAGRLLGARGGGRSQEPVRVVVRGDDGRTTSRTVTTNADGRFSVGPVAAGSRVQAVYAGTSYFSPRRTLGSAAAVTAR